MGLYICTLCNDCKLPIGRRDHQKYTDEVTGLEFIWHSDDIRDCWNEYLDKIFDEYFWLILNHTRRKEIA
jgi:hypothetical protein